MRSLPMMRRFAPSLLMIAAVLTGCAAFATHDEYGAYRATRLAPDERARLIALQQYAEHHPNGNWIAQVQAAREEHEDEVWGSSNTTREGLEWYLRVYPDGQYVEQARPRLAALQHVADTRAEQAAHERELRDQQRAEAAEARRTWVTRAVQYWTRTLVGLRRFGSSIGRIARANEDFARAFGQAPAPTCTPDYCIKHYGQVYHIPVPGATRIDRHIDVYLRLVMSRGRVQRAEILLPQKGFSRWYEMENRTVVTDEDPEQRMAAINWALERIQPLIEEVTQERIDVIPEPIATLEVHDDAADSETAPTAPDAAPTPPDETPPVAEAPATGEGGEGGEGGDDSLSALLEEAAGNEEETPEQVETEPETQAEPETLVLPIGLLSYRHRNLNVVVFAAGDEDYGEAYDGIIVERAPAGE